MPLKGKLTRTVTFLGCILLRNELYTVDVTLNDVWLDCLVDNHHGAVDANALPQKIIHGSSDDAASITIR